MDVIGQAKGVFGIAPLSDAFSGATAHEAPQEAGGQP
jgi:hypothetical protein